MTLQTALAAKARQREARLKALLASNPDEEWRPVPGHPTYFVSQFGRVRRGPYLRKATKTKSGYVAVSIDGRTTAVHRLVAAVFIGPRPDGLEVRHLNDVKTDNQVANLVYGTHSQNMLDCVANGNNARANRTHCKHGHPFDAENTYLVDDGTGRTRRQCRTCRRARSLRYVHKKQRERIEGAEALSALLHTGQVPVIAAEAS